MKKMIKSIAALGAGVAMLGATLGGALAVNDLGNLPSPFVQDSALVDTAIVLGETGNDAAARDDINNYLGGLATAGGVTVTGGEDKDIPLNNHLANPTYGWTSPVQDQDVDALQDTVIDVDIGDVSNTYDVHDQVYFGTGIRVETGLTIGTPDDDFGSEPFLKVNKDSVKYSYVFDDSIKQDNYFANTSTDDSIIISFLGNELEIIGSDAANKFTALVGEKVTLQVDETYTDPDTGAVVTLVDVASGGAVFVDVDGETDTISSGQSKQIGGTKIKNQNQFYTADREDRRATLVIGSDTTKTYTSGDYYIGSSSSPVCDETDTSDPDCWKWEISGLNTATPTINITFATTLDSSDEVIRKGDALRLPDDFIVVSLTDYVINDWLEYEFEECTEELHNSTGGTGIVAGEGPAGTTSEKALCVKALGGTDDGFKVGTTETDDVLIFANNTWEAGTGDARGPWVYYKDPNDVGSGWKYRANDTVELFNHKAGSVLYNHSLTKVTMQFDDTKLTAVVTTDNVTDEAGSIGVGFQIDGTAANDINFTANVTGNGIEWLGAVDGDAKSKDLTANNTEIGTWEDDTMTYDGIKIFNPDSYGDSDKWRVAIPGDVGTDFRMTVTVSGESTTGTTSAALMTADDVSTPSDYNLILVGGPCVNSLTASFLGVAANSCGDSSGFNPGEGYVELMDNGNKVAMIVAGWEVDDTRRAAKVVANPGSFDLAGKSSVTVTGTSTSLNDITVV